MLLQQEIRYRLETPADAMAVDAIADEAFGPGRFARAAERVREFAPLDSALCFVASLGDDIVGSVRLTPIAVGARPSLMLGPLAVRPAFMGRGIGKVLMQTAASAARERGETSIILVGDPPYYKPLAYEPLPRGSVLFPRPVDPRRILALDLKGEGFGNLHGLVRPR